MRRDHGGNPDKSQEASESTRGDHADAADEFQEALKSSVLDAIDAMQPDGSLELAQEASEASVLGAKPAKGRSGSGGFTLLTSLYMDASGLSQGHTDELVSAFIVNLANPNIWSVHVLFESNTSGGANACGRLPRLLREHSFASSLYEPHAHKITCVPVRQQPTYGDFFRYASSSLANHDVILANTDIVFDRTLALLKHPVDLNVAHVLSVLSPPYNGQYKQIFGKECQITNRCEIPVWSASTSTGGSWDAYIFRAPLPHSFNFTDLDFVMNINGAENLAGFQLETQGGRQLSNPCLQVHAFHWHCTGGKMHNKTRISSAFGSAKGRAVMRVLPCYDCPGALQKPYCFNGLVADISNSSKHFFPYPDTVKACLSSHSDVQQLDALLQERKLGWCRTPAKVDCLINHGEWVPHVYV